MGSRSLCRHIKEEEEDARVSLSQLRQCFLNSTNDQSSRTVESRKSGKMGKCMVMQLRSGMKLVDKMKINEINQLQTAMRCMCERNFLMNLFNTFVC